MPPPPLLALALLLFSLSPAAIASAATTPSTTTTNSSSGHPSWWCPPSVRERRHTRRYGIVPLRRRPADDAASSAETTHHDHHHPPFEVLLVRSKLGYVSFPKGGAERGDASRRATAERELREETRLRMRAYLPGCAPLAAEWPPLLKARKKKGYGTFCEVKRVEFFVALVEGEARFPPPGGEIAGGGWYSLRGALAALSFESDRRGLSAAWRDCVGVVGVGGDDRRE
jgi:8-oxo-dGTP pyrophosphatase MutT (NUDIX family)